MDEQDRIALVRARVEASIIAKQKMLDSPRLVEQIASFAGRMIAAVGAGRKILLFGNGGSAADAQHIAAELVGRFKGERRALPVLALTTDTSALTAIGNDFGFADVFARQVEALGNHGDVAMAISTSGNSANVVRAAQVARARGLFTLGLTGADGGKLRNAVDECACVPATDTARIQEVHILIGHILCELIEQALGAHE